MQRVSSKQSTQWRCLIIYSCHKLCLVPARIFYSTNVNTKKRSFDANLSYTSILKTYGSNPRYNIQPHMSLGRNFKWGAISDYSFCFEVISHLIPSISVARPCSIGTWSFLPGDMVKCIVILLNSNVSITALPGQSGWTLPGGQIYAWSTDTMSYNDPKS